MSVISPVHLPTEAAQAFKGQIALSHPVSTFSNAKVSINTCLASGPDMALFTAETSLYKKSVKASPEPYTILVNVVDLFPVSSTLSQALKATT